jgi:SAM-dependent methyltransferase
LNHSSDAKTWDFGKSRAEIHEDYLVPAMYAQWAIQATHMAEIDSGNRVLDVGCGTGILARKASEEVGFTGKTVGFDLDEEMLTIARRLGPQIEWHQGNAGQMPFEDGAFNRVVSQFMLPELKNRVAAAKEMWRVLAPGGRLLIAVWAPLHNAPAINTLVELTRLHAGFRAADLLARPWELGHEIKLKGVLETAGIGNYSIRHQKGSSRFPDPVEMVELWLRHSPVQELIKPAQYQRIFSEACEALETYRVSSGELVCAMDATIVIARKPG